MNINLSSDTHFNMPINTKNEILAELLNSTDTKDNLKESLNYFEHNLGDHMPYIACEQFNEGKESLESFLKRLDIFFEVNEIPVERQGLMLLNNLASKIYGFTAPDLPKSKTYKELVSFLKLNNFTSDSRIIAEHSTLKQKS